MAIRQKVISKSEIILFGKHKYEPFWNIIKTDPQYILWLDKEEIVDMPEEFIEEAEPLAAAQHRDYLLENYNDTGENDDWGDRD